MPRDIFLSDEKEDINHKDYMEKLKEEQDNHKMQDYLRKIQRETQFIEVELDAKTDKLKEKVKGEQTASLMEWQLTETARNKHQELLKKADEVLRRINDRRKTH